MRSKKKEPTSWEEYEEMEDRKWRRRYIFQDVILALTVIAVIANMVLLIVKLVG